MINEGDKIAVCVSGGRGSMLIAKCTQDVNLTTVIAYSGMGSEYCFLDD